MATPILEMEGTLEEFSDRAGELAGRRMRFIVFPIDEPATEGLPIEGRSLSARELMKLPSVERNRILAAQAEQAEQLYRNNPELLDFEIWDDIIDETP